MNQTFGAFVRQKRMALGISLRGLAARLGLSPIEKMNFSVVTVIFGNGKRTALKISEDREKAVRSRLCGMAGRKAVDG